jgi:peroxiredoxin
MISGEVRGEPSSVGKKIDAWSLPDARGEIVVCQFGSDEPIRVVAFLGVECPLAKLYAVRLSELAHRFADRGVRVIGIDANVQDSSEEIGQFGEELQLNFPLCVDADAAVADRVGAQRTPEVFLIDGEGTIRYQGRVDDQYGFDGTVAFHRPQPQRNDLEIAVEEVLAGLAVSEPYQPAPGCLIGRRAVTHETSSVTWSKEVAPIVQQRCQPCHREGEAAPFPLMTYADTVGWSETIGEVVAAGRMPPWQASPAHGDFANDLRLTDQEKQIIAAWVGGGAPEGDVADLPPGRDFPAGWQIEPDQVIYMSEEPFEVPAQGSVDYQNFVVDLGFEEDRWVRAAECRPGARSVVHHINVFVARPELGSEFTRDALTNELLWGYAPGYQAVQLPPGMAMRVPAGSRLVFQLHYVPRGVPEKDRSCIGLSFVDADEVTQEVRTVLAVNATFEIPAGVAMHEVNAQYEFEQDKLLLGLIPHMHLRGHSFVYEAFYLDGSREVLLEVPRYDFNFQTHFVLKEPKLLPAGTIVRAHATFDNSAENRSNPDPTRVVRWGDQTTDEMMIGYMQVAAMPQDKPEIASQPTFVRNARYWRGLLGGGAIVVVAAVMAGWIGWRGGRDA